MTERCDLQDHIVPYMLDERHVEDTLFIVVEEDFRFFNEEQGEPIAPKLELKASQSFLQSALEPEMLDSFPGEADKLLTLQSHWQTRVGVPGDHKKSTSSSSRDELSFTTRATKPTRKELEGESPSPLLENLVRLCTAAHRKHIGDIVWFCYNEDEHKKSTMFPEPQFGSNGIAVSRPGARWIQKEFPNMPVWHWDVELKKRLEFGHARASYIFPQWDIGRSMPALSSQAIPPEFPHGGPGLSKREWPLWSQATLRGSCGDGCSKTRRRKKREMGQSSAS